MPTENAPRVRLTVLEHSARTALASVTSLLAAQLFRLPEAYWAPITTLVITQSSLGAAFSVSWKRFAGTVLGALVGGLAASYFPPNVFLFGLSILILGLLCALVGVDRSAYRFAGVTLSIVVLVHRTGAAWQVALHRFAEVSIGISIALFFAILWPEGDDPPRSWRSK
jgi:uncharacterized membrane protein YccC